MNEQVARANGRAHDYPFAQRYVKKAAAGAAAFLVARGAEPSHEQRL